MEDRMGVILPPKVSLAISEGHYAVAIIRLYNGLQFLANRVEELEADKGDRDAKPVDDRV